MPVSPSSQNPQNPQISGRKRKDVSPDKATAGTEKQNTMKGADFGKAIGINKPANVRDKIRKWQQELEGDESGSEKPVSPAPDNDSGTPASSPKLQPTPKTKELEENMALKTVNITPGPKKAQPIHNKLDQDVQLATAPKKRVVSDSHWRNKKSPPKDPTTRPSPKPLPNAWVRPAVRKQDSSGKQDNAETKPPTTSPPIPRPLLIYTSKSTGQRTRSQRKRRPSRPTSSGNDERPKSSGSGSGKGAKSGDDVVTSPLSPPLEKEKEKTELVRVRRRRRAQTSPQGSLSAEDVTPVRQKSIQRTETALSEDPANIITLEYESNKSEPRRDEDIRERRRKRRPRTRSEGSQDASLERTSAGRRPSNRKAYQKLDGEEAAVRPAEPGVFEAPPKVFGNRLEAWLDGTPDPFVDGDSHRRRKPSKESISTLQLSAQQEKSDCSGSAEALDESVEDKPKRANSGRRRRRQRSSATKISTQDEDEAPSTTISDDITATTLLDQGREVTSSPTLKRRGARRAQSSPTKDRSMSLSPTNESLPKEVDATSSAPSSFVDASTMELGKVTLRPPPDNYAMRRMFPSTGKRLSTIASVETFATKNHAAAPSEAVGSEVVETVFELNKSIGQALAPEVGSQLVAETSTIVSRKSTRRNRLASHADLISVLSMPKAGTRSIVSARSIRTNRSRLATATIDDIMKELQSDEIKYMRELRTLVDGVIPVLLSCVLSKSDSALAIGLFSPSAKTDPNNVTKPIVDMGVSLERLKTLHKRVPKEDSEAFLSWTQSAQRVYSDYINAWRLGFQDVVVSLAPADEDPFTPAKVVNGPEDAAPWDEGLPRNAEGYVVNGDGERVDVAYMLKRPLVRLKYLTKSIKGINHVKPSERAEKMANIFQELVTAARKRSNDEHARLEDEAASNIDPTRARDPRSLAPLAGVRIDPARCVRARDHFDMHLYHSSGQEVNCRIEMLLRDDATGTSKGGDVLICEVDNTGRWLLLPPIQQGRISARNGDLKGEIIVMIRGYHAGGSEWQEVMSLTIDDEQAGFEWVHMLGLNPIPPQLSELKRDQHAPADGIRPNSSHASSSLVSTATGSTLPQTSRTPSPHEVEIPIGEQANETSKQWGYDTPDRRRQSRTASPITPPSGDSSLVGREADRSPISTPSPIELRRRVERADHTPTARTTTQPEDDPERTPRSLNDAVALAGTGSPNNLKRTKAKRLSKNLSPSPTASRPSRQITLDDPIELPKDHAHLDRPNRAVEARLPRSSSKRRRSEIPKPTPSAVSQSSSKGFSVWMPSASDVDNSDDSDEDELSIRSDDEPSSPSRPQTHRRVSSVPTIDLPTIPRLRKTSQPTTPIKKYEPETVLEAPVSAPPKLQEQPSKPVDEDDDKPPPVPPHRSPSPATPLTLKASNTPVFVPTLPAFKNKRRSSSPLKHEYEPSTCTESSSESEEEVSEEEDALSTSESSEDELEDDIPTPLMPISQMKQPPRVSPPASIYTLPNDTITPSQSASNTPYRTVPQGSGQASKAVASIFSWSDVGRWDSLHPEECSIVITPGKIEVFEITAAHSKPFITDGDEIIQPEARTPLIAVELTPLVPLRKSTAIDISIRSPPTADSRIRSGNNIMLRSRNPTECAQLYAMINHSRINNPTYIALQNARGPYGQTSWAEAMDRQNAARQNTSSGGWLAGTLGRRSSYRKTTTRAASISAATESSVGTMNTALRSALGRFSFAKNSRFSIRNSTLGSRSTNSFDTGSSGSGSGNSTPNGMLDPTRAVGAPAGITNTKCRLYERDSLTKWRDMGSARLTIMLPTTPSPSSPNRLQRAPGSRDYSQEKRILVTGKSKGEVLLDVTLSESCFERVARSGIAVSVWEDIVGDDGEVGRVAKTGGVSGARARIFMIQMKSERECAYCFSLLGKLRY